MKPSSESPSALSALSVNMQRRVLGTALQWYGTHQQLHQRGVGLGEPAAVGARPPDPLPLVVVDNDQVQHRDICQEEQPQSEGPRTFNP